MKDAKSGSIDVSSGRGCLSLIIDIIMMEMYVIHMTKTQIQLPDPLYREVKRVARERDWSLAEVLRRGAEYIVRCYPSRDLRQDRWVPPTGKDLGKIKIPYQDWRGLAQDRSILESEPG